MIKKFVYNALNSWVTSGVGAVLGGPQIMAGISGLFDEDPGTGIVWKALITGIGILFAGMMTRDHTRGWITPSEAK